MTDENRLWQSDSLDDQTADSQQDQQSLPDTDTPTPSSQTDEQEAIQQRLNLLNSQLVMYARDFRRLIDSEKQKTMEVVELKRKLGDATKRLEQLGASVPHDEATSDADGIPRLVGKSQQINHTLSLCERVAASSTTVLLSGETGTGKELTARRIHAMSPRRNNPFVAINCAALPESLLESELFGHEKGAFTGAQSTKSGLFELSDGGTLLLDEVGEMPTSLQVKLLRILEERRFRRIGGAHEIHVDTRVIAATNRDLKEEVASNRFRPDLYYRLNVFPIELPPLRERVGDIALLIGHFLGQFAGHVSNQSVTVDDLALSALMAYRWPGNIRELRNVIERAVLLSADGVVNLDCLPPEVALLVRGTGDDAQQPAQGEDQSAQPSKQSTLATHEKSLIIQALEENKWNKAAAARQLGISWDNLRYRIKKYNLKPPARS